jgi:DNA-binding XRE family transcriptional regulator
MLIVRRLIVVSPDNSRDEEDPGRCCLLACERIRSARTAVKWTQEVLAEYAGIDSTTVNKTERGIGNPGLLTLVKIARALDKSCMDFFPA